MFNDIRKIGTSLAVQWLGLCASTAGGMGSIPGWGTKIPHAMQTNNNNNNKSNVLLTKYSGPSTDVFQTYLLLALALPGGRRLEL